MGSYGSVTGGMANRKNLKLHFSNDTRLFGNVSDVYYQAVIDQLMSEGIYADVESIPKDLSKFIVETWSRAYTDGYMYGCSERHLKHCSRSINSNLR